FSGISTGTERLLWEGRMPEFPGMGYPLVPGYETVGRVVEVCGNSPFKEGQLVFVPGSSGYRDVRGLFGGTASRIVVSAERIASFEGCEEIDATLMALAATAHHAVTLSNTQLPDLVIGNGVLGRLASRMIVALGGEAPLIWEANPARRKGSEGFEVIEPGSSSDKQFHTVLDVSGDSSIIDQIAPVLKSGGEIVLAGFYSSNISFAFPPVFMKEARFRIAAEWQKRDLEKTVGLVADGKLGLGGLVTHTRAVGQAHDAYETAFGDPGCLKMVLDWREFE
ncbi:MAG: chlorophyll synthesis pathway protein BchC, partial [Pseudomonadota bacterium]